MNHNKQARHRHFPLKQAAKLDVILTLSEHTEQLEQKSCGLLDGIKFVAGEGEKKASI